jgi:Trypsin-co-occurring domain 1
VWIRKLRRGETVPSRTEFPLASGGTVVVETAAATGVAPAGRGGMDRAAETLRDSLKPVIAAASDVIDAFRALPRRPDGVEVRFGVSLDAKVGAVIASGTAGVHLDVTLRWDPEAEAEVTATAVNASASLAASGVPEPGRPPVP